jgi:hypothetical protein
LIVTFSRKGDAILDPFVGSGQTLIAARKLERIGIGFHNNVHYVQIARKRLPDTKADLLVSLSAMPTPTNLIDELQQLENRKREIIDGLKNEITEKIDTLNRLGYNFRLVEGTEDGAPARRTGKREQQRATSEDTFLSRIRVAANRRWGKISDAKKEELWKKEEPHARKFYKEAYVDGFNRGGAKYKTVTIPK